jgi:hypothetical protein
MRKPPEAEKRPDHLLEPPEGTLPYKTLVLDF